MSESNPTATERRDAWIEHHHKNGGHPKVLLKRLIAAGDQGTKGTPGDADDRKRMTPALADQLLYLVNISGISGPIGRAYLIDVLRWHYRYHLNANGPVNTSSKLKTLEAEFIRFRAYQLIDDNRDQLPHPVNDREAT